MSDKLTPDITPQLAISAYHVLQQYCTGKPQIAKAADSMNIVQNVFKAYHVTGA